MRIPGSVQVGVHSIAIIRKDLDAEDAYGVFDSEALTISLDSSLSGSLLVESFCHELIEALNFFAEAEMEHKTIQVFGLLLAQIMNSICEEKERGPTGGC